MREAISVTSSVSVGADVKQTTKTVVYERTGPPKSPTMDPNYVSQLVQEECDDVDQTLKLAAPKLQAPSPGNYALQKKLQNIRLTSENIEVSKHFLLMHTTLFFDF